MGECFVGSRYFTAFVENAFSLPWAMKTSILGPSIFTVISMKFLLGPLGVPRTPQNYFWKSPRRSQGRPWGFQGRPEGPWGRSRDPLGPPWAPLGLPRNAPGRFLNAQGSLGALQCHLGTLFSRPGVLQDIVFQRYCIKSSGILRMTFR